MAEKNKLSIISMSGDFDKVIPDFFPPNRIFFFPDIEIYKITAGVRGIYLFKETVEL